MTNKAKSYKRDRARLRRVQNPHQVDFLRMRKVQKAGTKYWATKKKPETGDEEKKEPVKKKAAKKVKKEEPELEVIDAELEEIYSDDDDLDE
ncbi:MAG: hypothetical protein ACTSU3_07065 [Candidatus Thorarchaeota archaeon]